MINIDTKRKTNFAVTLTPCYFREHTYIARVPRKMITTDQILDLVAAHNQGIDRYQVGHAMELLKKEILEQAELGFAVDIMEICKLYIAPCNGIKSLTPEAEIITGFEARFCANEQLNEKLKTISASVTSVMTPSPQISQIENPVDGTKDKTLKATFSARLIGKKLKVGGAESGIWFVPETENNEPTEDESTWIKVPEEFITKNTSKMLEFHLPRLLTIGKKYFIQICTSERSGYELKAPITGISKIPITIEE